MDIIIETIKKNIPPTNLRSIILSGGFGRGEGSVIVEGEKVTPLKDYDILVILKKETINGNDRIYKQRSI